MSSIIGSYTDPNNPTVGTLNIGPATVLNGLSFYPIRLNTSDYAILYLMPTANPGIYLVSLPQMWATLTGNTLTLPGAGGDETFQKSVPANAMLVPINFFNGTQSMPTATMQPVIQTNPATVAGMRFEEPQHTKIKNHRGKKHCKKKH